MSDIDWLSHLLQMITVTGRVEVRCVYGAPWQVAWDRSAAHEIPYHVVLEGRAVLEDTESGTVRELASGDIVLLPHGAAHVLHDGSGHTPGRAHNRQGFAGDGCSARTTVAANAWTCCADASSSGRRMTG